MPKGQLQLVPIRVLFDLGGKIEPLLEFEVIEQDVEGALGGRYDSFLKAGVDTLVLCELEFPVQQAELLLKLNHPGNAFLRNTIYCLLAQITSLYQSDEQGEGEDKDEEDGLAEDRSTFPLPRLLQLGLLGGRHNSGVKIRLA